MQKRVVNPISCGLILISFIIAASIASAACHLTLSLWFPPTTSYELLDSTLPVQLAWQFQPPDPVLNPPSFGEDGTIYVKAGDYLYALNPENGEVQWQYELGADTYGFVLPYKDMVFVTVSEDSVLQALHTQDGSLVWEVSLQNIAPANLPFPRPTVGHLLADNNYIYASLDLRRRTVVLAFEPNTGHLAWKAPTDLPDWPGSPFALFASQEGVIVDNGDLIILDKATGQTLRWEETLLIQSFRPPSYDAGVLYPNGEVARAIEIDPLQEKWHFNHECPGLLEQLFLPQVIEDGIAYLLTTCSLFYAVEADTGLLLWRYEDEEPQSPASFVVFQGVGYLLTLDATLHALNLDTGQEVGRLEAQPGWVGSIESPLVGGTNLLLLRFGSNQLFAFRQDQSTEKQ